MVCIKRGPCAHKHYNGGCTATHCPYYKSIEKKECQPLTEEDLRVQWMQQARA